MRRLLKLFLNIGFVLLIVFFISWSILSFFGYFDLIKNVELPDFIPIRLKNKPNIDFVFYTNFISKGAFIQGKPIKFNFEMKKIDGENFDSNNIFIGGSCRLYHYPLHINENSVYDWPNLNARIIDNGRKLIGGDTIVFLDQGDCDIRLNHIKNNEFHNPLPNTKIDISPANVGLDIEFNQRILSLTLIMLALTSITLALALIEFRRRLK